MKFSWRAVLCAVVMVGTTGAFKACKTDGPSTGGEDPPTTADDRFEVNATGATALSVLANDTKLDHEPLTYSIEESPFVGSAEFNANHTVRLTLPSGFRGATKFKYKVTNSVGGFSVSSVAVFVDVPAYRALFAAKGGTASTYEIYTSDLLSTKKISNATTGNFRLQNLWTSKKGALIAYERGDGSTTELFFVKTTTNDSPVKFPATAGRNFVGGGRVVISEDDRWLAYLTTPSSSGTATSLYVLDANSPNTARAVGFSAGLAPAFTQWVNSTQPRLYFVAPAASGHALLRAATSSLDAPERVSPIYANTDQETQVLVSPDEDRILIVGRRNGQEGAFFIDPANVEVERRLTTDMTAGAVMESYLVDDARNRFVYVWRAPGSATARLSYVDINADSTPQAVLTSNIVGLSDMRSGNDAVLITRGTGAAGSDGLLYEVTLATGDQTLIASSVTGGLYDGTVDRVYTYSRTLPPSVIQRSDFERTPTPLVKSSTPAGALFVTPLSEPSVALVEDTSVGPGLLLVNASAPGKTLRLTDMPIALGTTGTTLYPTIIVPVR